MNRRTVLTRLGAAAAGLAGCLRRPFSLFGSELPEHSGAVFDGATSIILLHTNDLHGHLTGWQGWEGELKGRMLGGVSRLAGAIHHIRSEAVDSVLLLDAGDLIGDTMIADLTQGRALIRAFNHLRYDALTFGNHEPDFGVAALRKRMEEAEFPFVAANLQSKAGDVPFCPPYVIKKVGGVSVGILGLTYDKTPWTTAPKNVDELVFLEPVAAIERYLPKMRNDGADVAVVLSHLGLSGDKQLAKSVQGIDVIVGGHSHNRMERAEQVGGTLIVQAGAHGSDLGRLDLTVQGGRITSHRHSLVVLDHKNVLPDEATEALVATLLSPHEAALNEEVGTASEWLVRAQTIAGQEARRRDEESPVDSLFADIIRQELKADIAFLPGVGYGVAIPPGRITAAQIRQLVPHEGKLVTMRLSGSQVRDILEQAVENVFAVDPKAKVGGMIQVAGLRFRYDSSREMGRRVTHVELTGDKWMIEHDYVIATNSMLAKGGHNQRSFLDGKETTEHGSQYETIKRWIRLHSPVSVPERGRIAAEQNGP